MNPFDAAQYGRAFTFRIPHVKRGVQDFAVGADWTPAAGDVKVTIDDGAAANIGSLPTATAVGNGAEWVYTLTASEMSGRRIRIAIVDAATKAIEDDFLIVTTVDHPLANNPRGVTHFGTVNGGANASVTLTGGNADITDLYKGSVVRLRHGGLTVNGAVAKSATATKWKTTQTLTFLKAGVYATKAATDLLTFSSAYTINNAQAAGQFWGGFLLQYDGTNFSTKAPASDQVYASQAAARAAVAALVPDSGCVRVGEINIQSKSNVKWTANTDDMTAASGCAASSFYDATLLGTVDEYNLVTSYTPGTGVCVMASNWAVIPQQGVDEIWIYGNPDSGTLADIADAILKRDTRGGVDAAAGSGQRVGENIAMGGSGVFTPSGGNYIFKHGDGTAIVTRAPTLNPGRAPIDGLA